MAGSRLTASTSLKYLRRAHPQLERRLVVADDDAVRVHLQGADRPHVIDAFLDGVPQGPGLVGAVDDDDHLVGVHDRADPDAQRRLGDLGRDRCRRTGELAIRVSGVSRTTRVREASDEPGSLNAM